MKKSAPVVAIVGRPNVGKSAVFNRLAGKRISIVHDRPGVTRDRITASAETVSVPLTLMDTGGIGETLEDGLHAQVELEADIAMEDADLIIFVVDGRSGLTTVDEIVATRLRPKQTPVWLAINKIDGPEHFGSASDFVNMGFGRQFVTSATTGHGFEELREALAEEFPDDDADEADQSEKEVPARIAIIGRPNVGKSSLVNAILNDKRTMVSSIAGTTRDSIDVPFEKEGHPYILIDTAGIRRRTKVDDVVEAFSVSRAQDSVRRADVCALVVDAAAGATMQERKIAQFMLEEHKPCVLVFNKIDLYHPDGAWSDRWEELQDYARREFFFMPYAPIVAVSAKDRQYLGKIFGAIESIRAASAEFPGTGQLNRLLQRAIETTLPPAIKGKRLKLYYATISRRSRDEKRPMAAPVIVLFINYKELLSESYLRYLENTIRTEFPFEGLPLKFDVRERRREERVFVSKKPADHKRPPRQRQAPKSAKTEAAAAKPAPASKKRAAPAKQANRPIPAKKAAKKALPAKKKAPQSRSGRR